MKRMATVLTIVCLATAMVFAADSGIPDTVAFEQRVYVPNNQGSWSTATVNVYFVTDDSVSDFNLPIKWHSTDGQIIADTVITEEALSLWDDVFHSIITDSSKIRLMAWSDLGGPDNLPLFTNMQRAIGLGVRFKISPTAVPQIVTIDTTVDRYLGTAYFDPSDGSAPFRPQIIAGSIYYGVTSGVDADANALPAGYLLAQNYPNPFNPTTQIDLIIPNDAQVTVEVFNLLGQKIKTLISEYKSAGRYSVSWDGTDEAGMSVPTGAYFYRMTAGEFAEAKKMMLLK